MKYFFPSTLELRAVCESWNLAIEKTRDVSSRAKTISAEKLLQLNVKNNNARHVGELLNSWLQRKAKRHLKNWIRALSEDLELPFNKLSIRGQKTLWGSCSEDKNINLNYKLLFLPAPLVEYVLIHELCHTVELNHSKNFWQLVERHVPNFRQNRKILREAHKYLPRWLK